MYDLKVINKMNEVVEDDLKYLAFFNGKKKEIVADSLYDAKKKAVHELSVPLSKLGYLAVVLAEKNGESVEGWV